MDNNNNYIKEVNQFAIFKMNQTNLTNKQLSELDSLFELVSQRQIKDFGNISASNKADGSLITSCDLWSDKQS